MKQFSPCIYVFWATIECPSCHIHFQEEQEISQGMWEPGSPSLAMTSPDGLNMGIIGASAVVRENSVHNTQVLNQFNCFMLNRIMFYPLVYGQQMFYFKKILVTTYLKASRP